MGKVLIKCIQTPMQKYFYDRSLDSVVMVNDEENCGKDKIGS